MNKKAFIASLIAQVVVILGAAFIVWGMPVSEWGGKGRFLFAFIYISSALLTYTYPGFHRK